MLRYERDISQMGIPNGEMGIKPDIFCIMHHVGSNPTNLRWASSREREMLPTSSQKGLSRVGHERPLNTNSCADQPTDKRRVHGSCIEGSRHR